VGKPVGREKKQLAHLVAVSGTTRDSSAGTKHLDLNADSSLSNGYVQIEYHPHSKRDPRVLSPEEFKMLSNDNEEPILSDERPWRPFRSREDFELAELTHAAALNKGQIDTLVKLIKRCEKNPGSLIFEGVQDVERAWEDASKLLTPVSAFRARRMFLMAYPALNDISLHNMRSKLSSRTKRTHLTPGHALCGSGSLITLWTQMSYGILNGTHRRFRGTPEKDPCGFTLNRGPAIVSGKFRYV
jgi:hypothetical protein